MTLSNKRKRVVFVTGTRADFGKQKSLISILQSNPKFDVHVFVTGMHLDKKYGYTIQEIYNSKIKNIFEYNNSTDSSSMEIALSNTIKGFSEFIHSKKPDMIVLHGDRIETLAGAITGAINNILVSHIEGGEVSGTIDESIRHSVSKLAHIHFTTDLDSKKRLIQLGEKASSIFILGSPDLDLMRPKEMIPLDQAKKYYQINFESYGVVLFHPVTTEVENLHDQVKVLCKALVDSQRDFIVIYPNNDMGNNIIIEEFNRSLITERFRVFPSLRFEYFLSLLKGSKLIVGNSSCGLREAPFFGVPTINIGSRQNNRSKVSSIINIPPKYKEITSKLENIFLDNMTHKVNNPFKFSRKSDKKFIKFLSGGRVWSIPSQKTFQDLNQTTLSKHFN